MEIRINTSTLIIELAKQYEISDKLQTRFAENNILTFSDLMTLDKSYFGRCRNVGRLMMAEFDKLRDSLTWLWNECVASEREEHKYGGLWEQRTWDAAVAIMAALVAADPHQASPVDAIKAAKALVEEYRKPDI